MINIETNASSTFKPKKIRVKADIAKKLAKNYVKNRSGSQVELKNDKS